MDGSSYERSGKLIDKKKYRWIMTQEVFNGVGEVFSRINNRQISKDADEITLWA